MSAPNLRLRTVVIPAAGRGTRMLPATQVTAKELLAVYDRPVIQFSIDEAIGAGAERIVIVVSRAKAAIRDLLGDRVVASDRDAAAQDRTPVEIVYVMQDEPNGLGHAIRCCKAAVLPGAFGVILPDDVIMGRNCLGEMRQNYTGGHMIAAMKVSPASACQYGIFSLGGPETDACIPVTGMVEKPRLGQAPSSIAAVGRYILTPMIFDVLDRTSQGAGGEVQLTDAISIATRSVPLTAFRFSGTRHDCGNHDGLLAASIARQAAVKGDRVTATLGMAQPGKSQARSARSADAPRAHACNVLNGRHLEGLSAE